MKVSKKLLEKKCLFFHDESKNIYFTRMEKKFRFFMLK